MLAGRHLRRFLGRARAGPVLARARGAAGARRRPRSGAGRTGSSGPCSRSWCSAFGIALPAAILIGNHVNASAQVGGYQADRGREDRSRAVRRALRGLPHAGGGQRGRQGRSEPRHDQARRVAGAAHDQQRLPAERARGLSRAVPRPGRDAADVVTGQQRPATSRTSSPRSPAANRNNRRVSGSNGASSAAVGSIARPIRLNSHSAHAARAREGSGGTELLGLIAPCA